MFIIRNGEKYTLTQEELRNAYYEQDYAYLLEDAKVQFANFVGFGIYDDDAVKHCPQIENFAKKYGITVEDVLNENSHHYLLDRFVEEYKDSQDCDIAENDMWQSAIEYVLKLYH